MYDRRALERAIVVPVHCDAFDVIQQDVARFAQDIERNTDAACRVLEPGDTLDV